MLDAYRTIWVDVTDLVNWEGQFTGIQRVEYNLATRFCELENVRFFALHGTVLHIIDFSALRSEIEAELQRNVEAVVELTITRSRMRRWLKKTLGKIVRATPLLSIDLAVRSFDQVAHTTAGILRTLGKRRAEPLALLGGEAIFGQGDLVLVLGGNWHIYNYMGYLGRALRRTNGISFGHVIYDLIPAMQPGFFPKELVLEFTEYIQTVLEDATVCFAISEHSRSDALKLSAERGIDAPPIHTFRLGDQIAGGAAKRPDKLAEVLRTDADGEVEPFIFCPGTVEVRKNHQGLYHAYRLGAERGLNLPHLVIGGKQGWLAGDISYQIENDPVVKNSITMLPSCKDREFAWLYENCLFTVYPSLYEGWGLPVAETLQYAKLCLASSATSLPEVGGDLVEYFSPDDSGEILEKIYLFATDRELLAKREALVAAHYSPATWDAAFSAVVTAIEAESAEALE